MVRSPSSPLSLLAVALLAAAPSGQAQVLFDGDLGTRPDRQGWTYLTDPVFSASATRTVVPGATVLDSTPVQSDQAGWFANLPPLPPHPRLPVLDRASGFTLRATLRLDEESHASVDRAGLSLIVLSDDLKGVELSFWTDEIWAQDDAPLFRHAEGAAHDTTAARTSFELCVLGDDYRLRSGGATLLEGRLRDYSAFGAPYDIPNFLFVGDDTSSARGRFELARVEIELEACDCRAVSPDGDGDGTPDCDDGCPSDPAKTEAGDCGCGRPDRDPDGDGLPDCEAVPGDLHPDGIGDDLLGLPDFVLAHRKAELFTLERNAWDLLAGDLAPTIGLCETATGALRACPSADGSFGIEDARLVRGLVAGRLQASCEPCSGPVRGDPAARRRPGDVAPRPQGGDGDVDVGDTVLTVRWAVGLDAPLAPEELLRADVAPRVDQEGVAVVAGDGELTVADVILVLRAAVGLETLRWPVRELHVELVDPVVAAAFSVETEGWPVWAEPDGPDSPHCPPGGVGGLDAVASRWSLTCSAEPGAIPGPARLGTLRYRAPEPVDAAGLGVNARFLAPDLSPLAATVSVSAP